jgi:acetyl esterase/lipase
MQNKTWFSIFAASLALLSSLRGQTPIASETNAPAATNPAPATAGVTIQKDIEYVPGGGAAHLLDLYLPESGGNNVPLVIFVHGGGWHSGSKDGCPAKFLADHGYAVASINYRLVPEAVFPAQLEDCRAALKFLREHAVDYNIKPDHVGVWGGSAGAHLVSLMGTAPGVDFSTNPATVPPVGKVGEMLRVQCVVDMYGPSDLTHIMNGTTPNPNNSAVKLLGPYTSGDDLMSKAKWASPVTYVRSDNPPFLIEHGDADTTVPMAQSQEFSEALQKVGVETTLVIMPGAKHAGGAFFTEENHQTVLAFFDKHLKPAK